MLVNTKDILNEAKKGGYAVGAFNLLSHPTVEAILSAAEETNTPVIIQINDWVDPNLAAARRKIPRAFARGIFFMTRTGIEQHGHR